ncbi:peroxidase 5-like [Hevea brasiliensis]|uniref:peroxidase 5-like n=1 Tax=Hevea brasiliensis TaxID=3981 RepID=UPI0025EF69CB|nr:peroxidase 5-like [Hevea brasiliensis]
MIALLSCRSLRHGQFFTVRDRIYSDDSAVDAIFASAHNHCFVNYGSDNCFKNLIQKKDLLEFDQILCSGVPQASLFEKVYSRSPATFSYDFAYAMIKMGNINPLFGTTGEIRKICSAVN